MEGEEFITLTRELIMKGSSSPSGSWNAKQLLVLGIKWPAKKGWLSELRGKKIPKAKYNQFLSLKRAEGEVSERHGSFHSLVTFLQIAVERSEIRIDIHKNEVKLFYCDQLGELKSISGQTVIDIAEQIDEIMQALNKWVDSLDIRKQALDSEYMMEAYKHWLIRLSKDLAM